MVCERNALHNEKVRKRMKELYYTNDGKTKSLFNYYKRKFVNDDTAQEIINSTCLELKEKLRKIHEYNQQQKLAKFFE